MKVVFGLIVLFSFSAFAQDKKLDAEIKAAKEKIAVKEKKLKAAKEKLAKYNAQIGDNPTKDQKTKRDMLEMDVLILAYSNPKEEGLVDGYKPGYDKGYMDIGMMGMGMAGGYAGGSGGGYPGNGLWNCNLSHDEKEINCASGKKYKLAEDGDESERSGTFKTIPEFIVPEKNKAKQE